ncbi:MAG: nicotinamide mononucleotide transporter [Verrucomicrobiales bacterium]|nr:nicotinamide mononucleotide transporter [Verrucomicrobiales bacterium]
MELLLQIWGGSCYLSNKILFAFGARGGLSRNRWNIAGWLIYLIGVPAWVVILLGHGNWIAASVEAGGIPAMLLGLFNSLRKTHKPRKIVNLLVLLCTYGALALGLSYSILLNGGIASITQLLEIGVMLGFLLGSYCLARNNQLGWIFFMLMNTSMATLMFMQGKPILSGQQLLSLAFVIYGFSRARKNNRGKKQITLPAAPATSDL